MIFSIIIPIFNEERHLAEFLQAIDGLTLPVEKELILVNDGSTDATARILENFSFQSKKKIIQHAVNLGKGAAIQSGLPLASGQIIGIQDADFEYEPNDLTALVMPLVNGRADIVYGSRYLDNRSRPAHTFHYLANRFLTKLSNMLNGLHLTDMETCYKMFRAEIFQNINLESRRFGFEPEVTAKISGLAVQILELPISYKPRTRREGKKITWRDGIAAVWHLLHFNVFTRQNKWFKASMPVKFLRRT